MSKSYNAHLTQARKQLSMTRPPTPRAEWKPGPGVKASSSKCQPVGPNKLKTLNVWIGDV